MPHDASHRKNADSAWPLSRHPSFSPSPIEPWTKNADSISCCAITPRNSAWLPISLMSFGAGVAVQHSRYGVSANISVRRRRVLPSSDLRMLDSSRTMAP